MSAILNDLATLRFVIDDGGRSRRHRYKVLDKLHNNRVLAIFNELLYAEQWLKQIREDYIKKASNEHQTLSVA
jgi:hypothetical protein